MREVLPLAVSEHLAIVLGGGALFMGGPDAQWGGVQAGPSGCRVGDVAAVWLLSALDTQLSGHMGDVVSVFFGRWVHACSDVGVGWGG